MVTKKFCIRKQFNCHNLKSSPTRPKTKQSFGSKSKLFFFVKLVTFL